MNANDSNATSQTDWDALAATSDDDIDYSDIPPLTDEPSENAVLRIPVTRSREFVQLDRDIAAWFHAHTADPRAAINQVLRQHVDRHSPGDR